MMRIVDFRSDTVTLPTPAMRQAMHQAEVGDDVYREDPTVRALEELAAEMTGKQAGLFMASGTMGNQVAILTHTKRGDEVICEAEAHVYYYEVGGMVTLAGVQPRTLPAQHGILSAAAICGAIRPDDIHQPPTTLICLENTHNRAGGTCYPLDTLREIYQLSRQKKIAIHMDGARLFNAAVAHQTSARDIAQHTDSVQFCISKGLCAPVGSLLVGSREYIERARRYRKLLGGGMRQAGILAAAGIVALTQLVDRLSEDHANARYLAEAIANLGFGIDLSTVETNIVIFDTSARSLDIERFVVDLESQGIKANQFGATKVRMVTHHGIERADVDYAISILSALTR